MSESSDLRRADSISPIALLTSRYYNSSHHSLLSTVHNSYYESSLYLSSHRRHSHRTLSTPFFRWDRACDGRLRNTQVSPRQSYKRRILEILFPMRPPTRCGTLHLYCSGIPYLQYKPNISDRHHRWDPRRSRYQYGKLMYERTCCVWYRSSLSQVSHSYSRIRLEWHDRSIYHSLLLLIHYVQNYQSHLPRRGHPLWICSRTLRYNFARSSSWISRYHRKLGSDTSFCDDRCCHSICDLTFFVIQKRNSTLRRYVALPMG